MRTAPEGLPASIRRALKAPVFGSSWRLAQRLPVTLPGAYWLVPGDGYLCVVSRGSMGNPEIGTTCAPTAQALDHGIASITIARPVPGSGVAPGRLIVGVAPDGARRVTVHTNGSVASVAVVDGVFVLRDAKLAPPDYFAPGR